MSGIEKFSELVLLAGVILTVFAVKKGPQIAIALLRLISPGRKNGEKGARNNGSSGDE